MFITRLQTLVDLFTIRIHPNELFLLHLVDAFGAKYFVNETVVNKPSSLVIFGEIKFVTLTPVEQLSVGIHLVHFIRVLISVPLINNYVRIVAKVVHRQVVLYEVKVHRNRRKTCFYFRFPTKLHVWQ